MIPIPSPARLAVFASARALLRFAAWIGVACCALVPARAAADEGRSFRSNVRLEVGLLSVGAAAWIASEALKPVLTPERCRWCDASPWEQSVHERVRWSRPQAAARFSDAMLFGVVPAAAFASVVALARVHEDWQAARVDALVLGEALVLTSMLTQLTKFTVARERPYASAAAGDLASTQPKPDSRLSFFSGHTSATFALAVAAGTTATLRGYREAPLVWALGLSLAALTGYLRMAGDRHYLTDVLTGALVGSAVGALVPWLHAPKREHR